MKLFLVGIGLCLGTAWGGVYWTQEDIRMEEARERLLKGQAADPDTYHHYRRMYEKGAAGLTEEDFQDGQPLPVEIDQPSALEIELYFEDLPPALLDWGPEETIELLLGRTLLLQGSHTVVPWDPTVDYARLRQAYVDWVSQEPVVGQVITDQPVTPMPLPSIDELEAFYSDLPKEEEPPTEPPLDPFQELSDLMAQQDEMMWAIARSHKRMQTLVRELQQRMNSDPEVVEEE